MHNDLGLMSRVPLKKEVDTKLFSSIKVDRPLLVTARHQRYTPPAGLTFTPPTDTKRKRFYCFVVREEFFYLPARTAR